MIFVNRRRIKQNSGVVKDPTKYWYIEKYVYGVLKETVEIALGSGTTFGSMSSGYADDTFYGWSISSTSTTRTFTSTNTYKNTTTAVKNNLDDKNTLKVYAVYSYDAISGTSSSIVSSNETIKKITVSENSTAIFGGYCEHRTNSTGSDSTYTSISLSTSNTYYAKINDSYVVGGVNSKTGVTISKAVAEGDVITICGKTDNRSSSSGVNLYLYLVSCIVPHYVYTTAYRVTTHGGFNIGESGSEITPIN